MRVLIVEDDRKLAEMIAKAIGEVGFSSEIAEDGRFGLLWLKGESFDAVITDIMMPKMDGYEFIRRVRAEGNSIPIIVLSAKGEVDDRVRGLDNGADDYLPKPFSVTELLSRLQALLRRAAGRSEPTVLVAQDIRFDLLSRKLFVCGKEMSLQPLEMKLVEHLMRNRGRVLPKSVILERVWDYSFDPKTNVVETRVCRLREKLGVRTDGQPFIRTVKGFGYAID